MNAIEDNFWSRAFVALGKGLARPSAVLAVSAHWFGRGLRVTAMEHPPTIHDFGGFPRALGEIDYPAPGSLALARRVGELLSGDEIDMAVDWGLDHGAWSVLVHLFPEADIPVVQLSVDASRSPAQQIELGARLRGLRSEGVMVLASGNVTHNLGEAFAAMRTGDSSVPAWAERFDAGVRDALRDRDRHGLERALEQPDGVRAHPTPDHWYPLLVAYGASEPGDQLTFPVEGFDLGSLSMRSCLWS